MSCRAVVPATVIPWTGSEVERTVRRHLLQHVIGAECAIAVLGIIESARNHHRDSDILKMAARVPVFPEGVVIRMNHHLAPETERVAEKG